MTSDGCTCCARYRRLMWLAVVVALIVGVPFLAKPFHIDDTVVLRIAQQITHHPLRPFAASMNWFGDEKSIFTQTTNPPFVSYYLAPLVAAFGFSEIPLHVAMLVFLVALAAATAALSRRFTDGLVWPVLFVMLSPAVVVSSNVMRDVPLAALSAVAAALFIGGVDRRRWSLLLAGSLVMGLAMLTKYSGVVMLPALALYAILQRRARDTIWLVAGLALFGVWALDNRLVHGQVHLVYLVTHPTHNFTWIDRLYPTLVIVGACLFMAPATLADAARRRRLWLVAGVVVGGGLALLGGRLHNGPVSWQYALWVTTGAALVFAVVIPGLAAVPAALGYQWGQSPMRRSAAACAALNGDGPRRAQSVTARADATDTLFLGLWAAGTLAFSIFFTPFQAVRHVIPAIAPLALLAVRLLRLARSRSRWMTGLLTALVVVQAVIAFAVAAADYEYAATYRDFARVARRTLSRPGREVWFMGSWGWQRHALSAGLTLLAEHGHRPRPGDLVIIPDRVYKGPMPEGLKLTEIEEKTYRGRIAIHTMDSSVGASFYSVDPGRVPYAFTRERTLEVFSVFRVSEPARPSPAAR